MGNYQGHWHPETGTLDPLPKAKFYKLLPCVEINMDNGDTYITRVGDLVAIQYIYNNQKVVVRRGRVYDIRVANPKQLSNPNDNISNITLDCSEQFSEKLINIKLKDILQIRHYNHEFADLPEKAELEPGWIEGPHHPVRERGLMYEREVECCKKNFCDHISKPDMKDVVKVDPVTGQFNDLANMNNNMPPREMLVNEKKPAGGKITSRGIPIG